MKNLEDELRELYRAVTDTIREEDLPGLYEKRSRPQRFRLGRFSPFAPLAAAAAVVVAIGIGITVPKLVSSPAPGRAGASGTPTAVPFTAGPSAATPPFMIITNTPNAPRPLLIVSAATGRTTASLAVPRANTVWFDVAPTASGTTFIAAATPNRGGLCNPTYLYTLTLSASGKVTSLRPWTDPVVPAEIGSISASADGRVLAFVETECRGPDQEIGIIRGRAVKTWREPYPLNAADLSLSADGSELGYTESTVGGQSARVRVLDTGSAAGNATTASKILANYNLTVGRGPMSAISADFTTMYVSWVTGFDTVHLTGYRIGAGGLQGRLFSRTLPNGEMISVVGDQALVSEGTALYLIDPVTGKATRIRESRNNAWGITW
jgi:hypothetical protein